MKIAVIIPAAGVGKRFRAACQAPIAAGSKPKTEIDLGGRPVLMRSVELFVNRPGVEQVIVAVNPDTLSDFKFRWGDKLGLHGVQIVPGGRAERWETVGRALEAVGNHCTHVAVHDAVRPLASDQLIDRVFKAAARVPAVIPAVSVCGTLKRVSPGGVAGDEAEDPIDTILGTVGKPMVHIKQIIETVDRTDLFEAQTPQLFELSLLRRAYAQVASGRLDPKRATDDAGLIEAMGETVYMVEGEPTNLKLTRTQDMDLAAAIVAGQERQKSANLGSKRLFASEEDV